MLFSLPKLAGRVWYCPSRSSVSRAVKFPKSLGSTGFAVLVKNDNLLSLDNLEMEA